MLEWKYLGMSAIRRQILPESGSVAEEWLPEGDRLRAADTDVDREMDRLMGSAIATTDSPVVVDAWLQPWLCAHPGAVRVWLESSFPSRVAKAQVSRIRSGARASPLTRREIAAKDAFSVRHFRRVHGVRFGPDPGLFDLIVDNSTFISRPTVESSDQGIAGFGPVLYELVTGLLHDR
ncbi:hypothetical protein [Herbidospora mongoliensis]|uniref:hypothetical protein n=1 Tax=Herbidospora mongoliensis TaxID=688067 RepID=UPI0012F75B04|nr:hypothetical protein [Herbidospora mongoliensis]